MSIFEETQVDLPEPSVTTVTIDDVVAMNNAVNIHVRALTDLDNIMAASKTVDKTASANSLMGSYFSMVKAREIVLRETDVEYVPPVLTEAEIQEVIDSPGLVKEKLIFAMEEEDNKNRNIIMRMIDAIIAGFKRLWDMIMGVFGKEEKPNDTEKRGNETKNQAASFAEKFPTNKVTTIEDESIIRPFVNLGSNLTLEVIGAQIKHDREIIPVLKKFLIDVGLILGDVKNVADEAKTGDEFKTKLLDFNTKLDNLVKAAIKEPMKQEDMEHPDFAKIKGIDLSSSHVIRNIMTHRGPGTLAIYRSSAGNEQERPFKAKFSTTLNEKGKSGTLHLSSNSSDIVAFVTMTTEMAVDASTACYEITEESNKIKGVINDMQTSLKEMAKNVDQGEDKGIKSGVKNFISVLNGIGQIQTSVAGALKYISDSEKLYQKIFDYVVKGNREAGKPAENADGKSANDDKSENK